MEREREREREKERGRERERQRATERQREREKGRERESERERGVTQAVQMHHLKNKSQDLTQLFTLIAMFVNYIINKQTEYLRGFLLQGILNTKPFTHLGVKGYLCNGRWGSSSLSPSGLSWPFKRRPCRYDA